MEWASSANSQGSRTEMGPRKTRVLKQKPTTFNAPKFPRKDRHLDFNIIRNKSEHLFSNILTDYQ